MTTHAPIFNIAHLFRGYSSAGRALAWHARGQRFDPAYLHQIKTSIAGFKSGLAVRKVGFCSKIATLKVHRSPSSRGLGHLPFTEATGVRIPVGTPQIKTPPQGGFFICGIPYGVLREPRRVRLSEHCSLGR